MSESRGSDRIAAMELVAQAWNTDGLEYVVTHGLEGYPDRLGRDLDILMDQRLAAAALYQADGVLRSIGWNLAVCPPDIWGKRLVSLLGPGDRLAYIELHTTRALQWAFMRFTDSVESPSGQVGPFPLNHWSTFVKTVLLPLLAGDLRRLSPSYLAGLTELGVTAEPLIQRGKELLGEPLISELASAALAADADRIIVLRGPVRHACIRWMLWHPFQTLRAVPGATWKRLRRLWTISGIRAVIEIPDEVDQERLVAYLRETLEVVFVDAELRNPGMSPRTWLNGAYLLSRQAALLELRHSGPSSSFVRAHSGLPWLRRSYSEIQCSWSEGDERHVAEEIARWMITCWTTRSPCHVPG